MVLGVVDDDDDNYTAPPTDTTTEDETMMGRLLPGMRMSPARDQRGAKAIALACPLRI